jgi:uncharacterized protein YndB with AHSA1/START domain
MKIIKKEIIIEAPVSKVWDHITDSQKIAGWLMQNDFEPKVGKEFFLQCDEHGKMRCVVKEIVPHKKLVYSFQTKAPNADTLVTITLAPEGKATKLTLVHTGWDALPPSEQAQASNYDNGWSALLQELTKQITTSTTK